MKIKFEDIKEDNGKTIKENNMKIKHNIPIGSLVEIKYDEVGGDGSCQKVHARLWVVEHTRDCDGTPMYNLCFNPIHRMDNSDQFILFKNGDEDGRDWILKNDISVSMINNVKGGYIEKYLTVIEITEDIKSGKDTLDWSNKNDLE